MHEVETPETCTTRESDPSRRATGRPKNRKKARVECVGEKRLWERLTGETKREQWDKTAKTHE